MNNKRLLVDGQVFQTAARQRGMGWYTVCLLQALLKRKDRSIDIILTNRQPLDKRLKTDLQALLPGAKLHTLDLWTTVDRSIDDAFIHNEAVLSDWVEKQGMAGADYFIPALFQEPLVSVFPRHVGAKTILVHDLIPYLYHDRYRPVMQYDNYLKRFKLIFEADLLFTNSQTVADDLHIYLGIPIRKLCRIDGAAIHTDSSVQRPKHVRLDKPFILLNTSDDPRKNNMRAVLGFETFRASANVDYQLVITSSIHRREQDWLRSVSKNLIFTGSIPEAELNWLYKNCELLLFVPESEGLGLPLLEAVDAEKKVVCSSIGVLREVTRVADVFYYCDYEDSYSIAKALERAVASRKGIDKKVYADIRRYYSWGRTAKRMVDKLDALSPVIPNRKLKVAVMTAAPSGLSGVGVTTTALHPVLSEHFSVDYYIEPGLHDLTIRPDYLQYVATCHLADTFSVEKYMEYDAVLYHIGNGDYHMESIRNALYLPGYLIVHDTDLREAYRVLNEGGIISDERLKAEASIDGVSKVHLSQNYSSLANRQLGILVHSQYAAEAMQEVLAAEVPVIKAHLPTNVPQGDNLHLQGRVTIGLAGAIADVKGLDVINLIANDATFSDCNIQLFGFKHASDEELARLSSHSNVSITTNVSDYQFQTKIAALDIFVNYRMIYKGETSNTTIEAMRQGGVVIVRNIGWFAELPDDVVVKVDSPEDVVGQLRELVSNPERMLAIGQRAKEFVSKHFSQELYIDKLKELLEQEKVSNPNLSIAKKLRAGEIKKAEQLLQEAQENHG